MSRKVKKKLCWNCEGQVGFEEEHCPFCGVYLSSTPMSGEEPSEVEEVPDAPYSLTENQENGEVPTSPFANNSEEQVLTEQIPSTQEEFKKVAIPMGLLFGGSIFFLFGLVLFLFSSEGKFTLQWSADFWYVYSLLSVGMLFLGWKSLQALDE